MFVPPLRFSAWPQKLDSRSGGLWHAVLFFKLATVRHRPDGGLMSDKHSQGDACAPHQTLPPKADSRLSHPDKYHRPVQSPGKLLRQLCINIAHDQRERQEYVDPALY